MKKFFGSMVDTPVKEGNRPVHSKGEKRNNILGLFIALLFSVIIIVLSTRIWEIDTQIPTWYTFDGTDGYTLNMGTEDPPYIVEDNILGSLLIKSIKEYGIRGLWFNNRLGAPETCALVDTPFLDLGIGIEYFFLTRFFNANTSIILQYIFGYMCCAFTMYLLLDRYTERVTVKTVLSICFAIAPYHFIRGNVHQTLSNYFVVPVFIYLSDIICHDKFIRFAPERYEKTGWKKCTVYVASLMVGIGNVYYAFAGLLCMIFACIWKMIKEKRVSVLWKEAVPVYVVLFGVIINLTPKIYYSLRNGMNQIAGIRSPQDAEKYSLKIIQLLLPPEFSRIPVLRQINQIYSSSAINLNENVSSSLGIIATIGFLLACGWVIKRFILLQRDQGNTDSRIAFTSFLILSLVLYSSAGGFGTIVNYFITPEIRAYNRFSIVISCLSLCMVCFLMDYILRWDREKRKKTACTVMFLIVFVFSLYSDVPVNRPGWQEPVQNDHANYEAFFRKIEEQSEPNSMVYELPFMEFPESPPISGMKDYYPALGYLYTETLRWSYGGLRGRNVAAKKLFTDQGMSGRFIDNLRKEGFSGVYIDTRGYEDHGTEILSYYQYSLGLTPLRSEDGKLLYFDIRSFACDDVMLVPGFRFIEKFATFTGQMVDMEMIAEMAKELSAGDQKTIDTLWQWIGMDDESKKNMTNEDYVQLLYHQLLGRKESDLHFWIDQLNTGNLDRKQVFEGFIASEEFHEKNL